MDRIDDEKDITANDDALLRAEIMKGIEQADRGEVEPLDFDSIKSEGRRILSSRRTELDPRLQI